MNINEKKEKRANFVKIYDLVSLNRNISLIQINLLLKTIRNVYEFFLIGQYLLEKFSPQKSIINRMSLMNQKTLAKKSVCLWIYPSSNEKYTQNFFEQVEHKILENIGENDFIIPLGSRAVAFAKQKKLNSLISFENLDNSFQNSLEISQIIEYGLKTRQFSIVKMVVYSKGTFKNFVFKILQNTGNQIYFEAI